MTNQRRLEAEIIVAGGGSAGCAAAIAAARRGRSVLLVEETNCLGGISTAGGVGEWFAGLWGLGDIMEEVHQELVRYGAVSGRHFNPEALKVVWQLMAEEAGVRILFHGSVCSARREGRRLVSVGITSCSHALEARGQMFVDATGEGDLGALAGAEFVQGHPETGRTLHMTLTFRLRDTGAAVTPHLPAGLAPINSEADLPGLNVSVPLPGGDVYCNMTKVMGRDPTDPLDLSAAELDARRQLARIVHFLQRTRLPRHALCASGARIGIREGRRLVGDYVLTEQDILGEQPRDFPDGVAVATCQIDFHSLTRPGDAGWRLRVMPYAIPLRCLTAKDLDNLLMAGKCISGDQVAQSSYRMTPTCCAMGQAAGTAAAMAVEGGLADIRELDVARLRRELTAAGMELDPGRHEPFFMGQTPDRADAD